MRPDALLGLVTWTVCCDVAENKTGQPRLTATGLIKTVEIMSSVHSFFQRFTGLEFRPYARLDLDGLAGTRIAPGSRLALCG